MLIREGILIKQAKRLVLLLADWLFPKECVDCGAEGAWLCTACRWRLSWQPYQSCLVCGADSDGLICRGHDWFLDKLIVATDYKTGKSKDLIKVCKYRFSTEAACELSELLWSFWQKQNWRLPKTTLVVAVPLSRKRLYWRGFNQSAIIAQAMAKNLELEFSAKELRKIKNTRQQASLLAQDRLLNLQDCFTWHGRDLTGRPILLIDDVATTGATLNECAKVLKQAGAKRVLGLVVAR